MIVLEIILGIMIAGFVVGALWEFIIKPILSYLLESKIFGCFLIVLFWAIIITVVVLAFKGFGLILDAL